MMLSGANLTVMLEILHSVVVKFAKKAKKAPIKRVVMMLNPAHIHPSTSNLQIFTIPVRQYAALRVVPVLVWYLLKKEEFLKIHLKSLSEDNLFGVLTGLITSPEKAEILPLALLVP